MKWIGLTGGLGTGKSTVAEILRQRGYVVLDADRLAGQVIAAGTPGLKSVIQRFGKNFLRSSGELNREKMSQEVFSNPQSLADLENIIHPLVQVETQRQKETARQAGSSAVFYDVPLLYEKNISGFDAVIVVASSEENQRLRVRQRNRWSESEINNRLKTQMPLVDKIQKADFVIYNNGRFEDLQLEVEKVLSQLEIEVKN